VRVTRIGSILKGGPGVRVRDSRGREVAAPRTGFDHFA